MTCHECTEIAIHGGDPYLDSVMRKQVQEINDKDCRNNAAQTPNVTCEHGCMEGFMFGEIKLGECKYI